VEHSATTHTVRSFPPQADCLRELHQALLGTPIGGTLEAALAVAVDGAVLRLLQERVAEHADPEQRVIGHVGPRDAVGELEVDVDLAVHERELLDELEPGLHLAELGQSRAADLVRYEHQLGVAAVVIGGHCIGTTVLQVDDLCHQCTSFHIGNWTKK
jgi:hypothetical protein